MSRPVAFSVKITGNFLGLKVNTSSNDVRNGWRRILRRQPMSREALLRDLRPLFKRRMEKRIPKLIRGLTRGIRDAQGTMRMEETFHGSHKPHRQIRNPLTRIVEQGTTYKAFIRGDKIGVDIRVHNTRRRNINFHTDMKKVPRVSTVWNRLDATCLPFVTSGNRDKVVQRWLEYTKIGLAQDLKTYFTNRDRARGN